MDTLRQVAIIGSEIQNLSNRVVVNFGILELKIHHTKGPDQPDTVIKETEDSILLMKIVQYHSRPNNVLTFFVQGKKSLVCHNDPITHIHKRKKKVVNVFTGHKENLFLF